jgi:hypothetical protein
LLPAARSGVTSLNDAADRWNRGSCRAGEFGDAGLVRASGTTIDHRSEATDGRERDQSGVQWVDLIGWSAAAHGPVHGIV